jgi:hypothetical protein
VFGAFVLAATVNDPLALLSAGATLDVVRVGRVDAAWAEVAHCKACGGACSEPWKRRQ